uniref:PLVAP n=1 Tax=Leptobrachium leishanense TaxID=445787 RepID=A0A8C5WIA9_9ANUR
MDKSYAMGKYGLESKDMFKSSNKNCWYYLKYFFLFTSIIQFLIILGLVLFMVYGNAHAFMENRLSDVERLNTKLLGDLKTQERHIQLMTINITRIEKERMAYFMISEGRKRELIAMNSTMALKDAKINSLTVLSTKLVQTPAPKCEICNDHIDKLNHSCIVERLLSQNARDRLATELRNERETCNTTANAIRNKLSQAESEKINCLRDNRELKNDKTGLAAQMEIFKGSCTTIENKFKNELENMKQNLENAIRLSLPDAGGLNYQQQHQTEAILRACRPMPDQISFKVDQALIRLRQDTTSVVQENSFLKVSEQRAKEDLKKCGQEKEDVSQSKKEELGKLQKGFDSKLMTANEENQRLKIEKDNAERELKESQSTVSRTSMQLVSLMETLQTCQKVSSKFWESNTIGVIQRKVKLRRIGRRRAQS